MEDEPVVIDSPQTIGTARGGDAMTAYASAVIRNAEVRTHYVKLIAEKVTDPGI